MNRKGAASTKAITLAVPWIEPLNHPHAPATTSVSAMPATV